MEMNTLGRLAFLFASVLVPGLSLAVVAGSIYMQGLASPFVGIFLGIFGMILAIKLCIRLLAVIDDASMFVHRRWPSHTITSIRAALGRLQMSKGSLPPLMPANTHIAR